MRITAYKYTALFCAFATAISCPVCPTAAYYDIPEEAAMSVPADISARAAVLTEAESGTVIWGKNEKLKLPMASTTKIMTALLTLESGGLDTEFTVDSEAVRTEGSSMGLREGDIVTKRALCIGMLLPSGNDAANCAAVRVGGSREDFVRMMNARAAELGMSSTNFVTPSGLHDDRHFSTAADMALLAAEALKNPDFAEICASPRMKLRYGNPPFDRWLTNTNKLLGRYEGCIGVKTGFTDEAGRCLVSAARRNGVTLICVTLGDRDDWNDHAKLLDYGFFAAQRKDMGSRRYYCAAAGSDKERLSLVTAENITLTEINGRLPRVSMRAEIPQMVYAPVLKGEPVGTLIISCGEREVGRIPIIAAEDIPLKAGEPYKAGIIGKIREFVKSLFG